MTKLHAVLAMTAILSAAAPVRAQIQEAEAVAYRVEVSGAAGYGRLYLGDSLWGSGPNWTVSATARPFRGWADRLGFELGWTPFSDSGSRGNQVSHDLDADLATASVVYHFRGHSTIQPFVLGGLSYVSADYTYRCVDCVFRPDPATGVLVSDGVSESSNRGSKLGFTFGCGMKIFLNRHLSIRPQLLLADTTPGAGYNWTWFQPQVGLGVHF